MSDEPKAKATSALHAATGTSEVDWNDILGKLFAANGTKIVDAGNRVIENWSKAPELAHKERVLEHWLRFFLVLAVLATTWTLSLDDKVNVQNVGILSAIAGFLFGRESKA